MGFQLTDPFNIVQITRFPSSGHESRHFSPFFSNRKKNILYQSNKWQKQSTRGGGPLPEKKTHQPRRPKLKLIGKSHNNNSFSQAGRHRPGWAKSGLGG